MRQIALRIWRVHEVAYPNEHTDSVPRAYIEKLLAGLETSRFGVAKPRLLARAFVDQLERWRQGHTYSPVEEVEIDRYLTRIATERSTSES